MWRPTSRIRRATLSAASSAPRQTRVRQSGEVGGQRRLHLLPRREFQPAGGTLAFPSWQASIGDYLFVALKVLQSGRQPAWSVVAMRSWAAWRSSSANAELKVLAEYVASLPGEVRKPFLRIACVKRSTQR
jgi:hypothetical protein